MKRHNLFLMAIICLFVLGCSTVKYTSVSGETFKYSRLGANTIQGFEVTKNINGAVSVKIDKTTTDSGELGQAMASFAKNYSSMAK